MTAWYFMMRLCTQGYYCMKDYCMHGSDVKVREISTLHDGHDLPEQHTEIDSQHTMRACMCVHPPIEVQAVCTIIQQYCNPLAPIQRSATEKNHKDLVGTLRVPGNSEI